MIALQTKAHEEIHRALTQQGEKPDESGSFMATVHKTITSARSAVTGIDADALSPFISGEESILEGQKSALSAKIVEMKSMKVSG